MGAESPKKIVLTGGPCAGKTTALVRIIEYFSSRGYKVFTIPEVPTIFAQAGMDYLTQNRRFFYEGEKATLQTQLDLEDRFLRMAQTLEEPSVIVCDRGAMDISAYMPPQLWDEITGLCGVTNDSLRGRYDAVLHLVSAADGAEQFYNTTTNDTRTEGLEKARLLDRKVIQAWTGHPHLRVINNHYDFETKINRVINEISAVLSLPQPITEERKYIVRCQVADIPEAIRSHITQTYLTAEPGVEIRLRRRVWGPGKTVNVHTTKRRVGQNEEVVTERQVSNALYESLMAQADPYRHTIDKDRTSFIWKGQYFELDNYQGPLAGLTILETKGITPQESVNFPPFITVVKDITGDRAYYNYNLALRK